MRRILIIKKLDGKKKLKLVKKLKNLPWNHPNQILQDNNGNHYIVQDLEGKS